MSDIAERIARIGRKVTDLVKTLVEPQPEPNYAPVVVKPPRPVRRRR